MTHDEQNNNIYIKIGSITVVHCATSETQAEGKLVSIERAGAPLNFTWEASASLSPNLGPGVTAIFWRGSGWLGTKQGGRTYGDLGVDFRS